MLLHNDLISGKDNNNSQFAIRELRIENYYDFIYNPESSKYEP